MQIEIGGRQTGKTTRMLRWLAEQENGLLVTFSEREADRLRKIVIEQELNINPKRIVSAENSRNLKGRSRTVAIDNLDMVLSSMFGHVEVVTITEDQDANV